MKNDKQNRRSIRLKGYDYSQAGAYFVTICTQNHICLLGDIVEGEMILNDLGRIVQEEWIKTEQLRPNVSCGKFVVMPNHFHGILIINESRRGVLQYARTSTQYARTRQYAPTAFKSPSQTIGAIVRGFKSAVTKQINQIRQTPGQKCWQRITITIPPQNTRHNFKKNYSIHLSSRSIHYSVCLAEVMLNII